jgi:hypothetical protein
MGPAASGVSTTGAAESGGDTTTASLSSALSGITGEGVSGAGIGSGVTFELVSSMENIVPKFNQVFPVLGLVLSRIHSYLQLCIRVILPQNRRAYL